MVCIENRYFPLLIFLTPNPVSIYLLLKISTSSFNVLDYCNRKKNGFNVSPFQFQNTSYLGKTKKEQKTLAKSFGASSTAFDKIKM